MDIALEPFRTVGRARREISATITRELTRADIAALGVERGIKPQPLKRIGDRHHALARNLASGMPDADAALIVGLQPGRISILRKDPAFAELLSFYQEDITRVYRDMNEKLHGVSSDALDILAGRLEDTPDDVSTNQLMEIVKLGADRSGHGPQTSTNLNVNVGMADAMQAARKRIAERKALAARTIEGEATEVLP